MPVTIAERGAAMPPPSTRHLPLSGAVRDARVLAVYAAAPAARPIFRFIVFAATRRPLSPF